MCGLTPETGRNCGTSGSILAKSGSPSLICLDIVFQTNKQNKMNYRKDIDGLRGVAVLAVIANHLPQEYLASGYLGVDVFFVISGFVITGSLFNQSPSSLSALYADFFARRIKRLLPALMLFVAFTSVYVLVGDPFPGDSIQTGIASLFGLSNIILYVDQLDYFAASSKLNAFTHTWSLGVEEQFYLLFPVVIWLGLFGGSGERNTQRFALIIAAFSLLSLMAFVYLYDINQPAAYFLTPMRIWELGAGILAYVLSISAYHRYFDKWLGKASLLCLLLLFCIFYLPSDYPAAMTLAAIVLTFWLLVAPPQALGGRLLAIPAVVFIGQISYSLYLWHWPVITQKAFGLTLFSGSALGYSSLMLGLASLSYYLVEKPLRKKTWSVRKGREIGMGLSISALIAVCIIGGQELFSENLSRETQERYPPYFLPVLSNGGSFMATCNLDYKSPDYNETMYDDCTTFPALPTKPMLWAMGDSHVGHLQGMLHELHRKVGVGIHLTTTNGLQFPMRDREQFRTAVEARNMLFERAYSDFKPGDVFLVTRLFIVPSIASLPEKPSLGSWYAEVSGLAETLAEKQVNLVLLGPLPFFFKIEHIKACPENEPEVCAANRQALVTRYKSILEQLQRLSRKHPNIYVFDPFPFFCPIEQEWCYPEEDSVFLFRDAGHLNALGSRKLAAPFIDFLRFNKLLGDQ
jgi:peptidoglycan/LPS O-acetylase OafA/YrhL